MADQVYFSVLSSETVNLARPFALRLANNFRPFLLLIRERKPCLLARFLFEG